MWASFWVNVMIEGAKMIQTIRKTYFVAVGNFYKPGKPFPCFYVWVKNAHTGNFWRQHKYNIMKVWIISTIFAPSITTLTKKLAHIDLREIGQKSKIMEFSSLLPFYTEISRKSRWARFWGNLAFEGAKMVFICQTFWKTKLCCR